MTRAGEAAPAVVLQVGRDDGPPSTTGSLPGPWKLVQQVSA